MKKRFFVGVLAMSLATAAALALGGCKEKAQSKAEVKTNAEVEKGFFEWLQSSPPESKDVVFSSDKKLSVIVIKNEAILDSNVSAVEIVETFEKIKEELNKKK
jgi:DNA recombination-dependent growth factor C